MKKISIFLLLFASLLAEAQQDSIKSPVAPPKVKEALKFNISEDGSNYFQVTFLNQTWLRYNESNPGTMVMGKAAPETFDIGLRRTRIQMFGQITDRVFLYFQFGQNNFNSMSASSPAGNRKIAAFFHDAVGEYRLTKKNQLKIGAGLTIANGLSRFSQPSIGTIMTLDVPVFGQATVDQTDQFSRKLSVYARGQISKFDYRVSLSDPFPVVSNGTAAPAISNASTFATVGHHKQYQAYVMYQFFEHEGHATPYMTGTYLGKKKVFNIASGIIHQSNAMFHKGTNNDTIYNDMNLWSVESFLDIPLNKEKGTAISAYAGYFYTDYGKNYLRYNGIMNPANGSIAKNAIANNGWGNAYPMFGTGQVLYAQVGYLLPKKWLGEKGGQLLPYVSLMSADYQKLRHQQMNVFDVGVNWLIKGHNAKITVDYQIRPTYYSDANGEVQRASANKNGLLVQYQIFF